MALLRENGQTKQALLSSRLFAAGILPNTSNLKQDVRNILGKVKEQVFHGLVVGDAIP